MSNANLGTSNTRTDRSKINRILEKNSVLLGALTVSSQDEARLATFPRRVLANQRVSSLCSRSCRPRRSRPLYRRRPRRPSGKSNNATCRFCLIYSRYPLEGPSTCKARVVICSHLDRIGLRSPLHEKIPLAVPYTSFFLVPFERRVAFLSFVFPYSTRLPSLP